MAIKTKSSGLDRTRRGGAVAGRCLLKGSAIRRGGHVGHWKNMWCKDEKKVERIEFQEFGTIEVEYIYIYEYKIYLLYLM